MPVLTPASYKPAFGHFNGHAQTVIPSMFRKVQGVTYTRKRLYTPDGDFIDLDLVQNNADKLVVVSHGLEGSADRHYVRGMAKKFSAEGYDVCAWNCRSCSGELNLLPRFYHHADTPDLAFVIDYMLAQKDYQEVVLVGFSMGGSMTVRYMGERGAQLNSRIKAGIAVSVPCDLTACAVELEKPGKTFYNKRFLNKLRVKFKEKAVRQSDFPLDLSQIDLLTSCRQFDDLYSAPLHGFKDAADFYLRASCKHFILDVRSPLLILNAQNDPFLGGDCFPVKMARENKHVFLEMPQQGGHVGFCMAGTNETYAEKRAFAFAELQ